MSPTTDLDTPDVDVPECQACGACCFSDLPHYVRVTGDDHARLGEDAERLVVWSGNRAFLRMEDGRCASLALDGPTGAFACTIYERRPELCRSVGRGTRACQAERALKADRALVALRLTKG